MGPSDAICVLIHRILLTCLFALQAVCLYTFSVGTEALKMYQKLDEVKRNKSTFTIFTKFLNWIYNVLLVSAVQQNESIIESQGRGSLVGHRLWGRTESYTTEAT